MKKLNLFLFWCCLLWTSLAWAGPKKVVLIAGPLDDHGLGTHEYENNILLLQHCLQTATNLHGIKTEVCFGGWPTNPAILNDADTIVLTSGGSDRKETDHPLYVGDRFAQLEKQMQRGCGLVMFHWSVFHPARNHEKITEWLGGYFDYENGTGGPTKKWFSKIEVATSPLLPVASGHTLLRGIQPFDMKEEFYFNLRFRENDPHFTPIFFKQERKTENIVAWAVERADGGRGFGSTCGHFYTNWWQPEFRKLVLNAIVWTAKGDVPVDGVASSLEHFTLPVSRKVKPAVSAVPAKKLRPATVPSDSGATAKEEAWKDSRWNQMDIGPFLASTVATPNGTIAKGLSIRIGEENGAAVVYDTTLCNVRAAWTGNFLAFDPARFGLINAPRIAGDLQFVSPAGGAWNWKAQYRGLFLHGKRVVLSYDLGDASVLESPWLDSIGTNKVFTRTFQFSAHPSIQSLSLVEMKGGKPETNLINGLQIVSFEKEGRRIAAAVTGEAEGRLSAQNEQINLDLAGQGGRTGCKVFLWSGTDLQVLADIVKKSSPPEDLASLTKPGPARWGGAISVKGERALPSNEPYVVDTLTVPYENPFKALMFLSGVDFFKNGDAAVCTIHGDVWLVSGIDDDLQNVRWKRFATGLFQPLGLRIVNEKIYVLGRDQITFVRDHNSDGEADSYENFYNGIKTSIGGHDYVTSLENDRQGNFYYSDPVGVHRVSPDGKKHETLATGFRNPNGMSVSPEGVITVAPQEGNWTPSSAICEIKPSGFYGYGGPQFSSERVLGYDAPLCWIPRNVDNSTGSQVWVRGDKWGPLKDQLLNLSFGRCSMMLVLRDMVDGVAQGAVVPLKPHFLSGAMRGTFRKQDGQLYVVGSFGWSTSASRDGCLQRVRYTGKKAYLPTALHVHANGIELTFAESLERETAEDPGSYGIEQWNYLYSKDYGSKEYSLTSPNEVGHDVVNITSAKLSADGRTIFLEISDLKPVMQMQIQYNLNSADGKALRGEIYNTINRVRTARKSI